MKMFILWYDRKPDFEPDYYKPHRKTITGKTPEDCMEAYNELSYNHDLAKYTRTEITYISS